MMCQVVCKVRGLFLEDMLKRSIYDILLSKIIFLFLIMIVKGGGAIQGYRYSRLVAVWFLF